MRYWLDTEFIDDGKTIELLSIGIVSQDGREFYAVNEEADLSNADDWVKENVLPKLCKELGGFNRCFSKNIIKYELKRFLDPKHFGKPEFWGYYASYDFVVMAQLFGKLINIPEGWPMYINDIKQLCNSLGDPKLPDNNKSEHNALFDALWIKNAYDFLLKEKLRQDIQDGFVIECNLR